MSKRSRAGIFQRFFIATRPEHRFAAVDDAVVVGTLRGSSSAGPRPAVFDHGAVLGRVHAEDGPTAAG
jgi:hypothetical protein